MKKRQSNSARGSALQITLSATLVSISVLLAAASFKAAPTVDELGAAIAPILESDKGQVNGSRTGTGILNTETQANLCWCAFMD